MVLSLGHVHIVWICCIGSPVVYRMYRALIFVTENTLLSKSMVINFFDIGPQVNTLTLAKATHFAQCI